MKKYLSKLNSFAIAAILLLLPVHLAWADLADLVDVAVLVETDPQEDVLVEDVPEGTVTGSGQSLAPRRDASYVSSGGFAVTGKDFIDAYTMVFDLGETTSVSGATLKLYILEVFEQNGAASVKLEFFSDNGVIEFTDYSIGFPQRIGQTNAAGQTEIQFDVTGPVNSALNTGRYIGFRVTSTLATAAIDSELFPAFAGVRFFENESQLEFVPGAPPATNPAFGFFDGYTLEVPNIDIPTVGEVYAQFQLVDANNQLFRLNIADITGEATAVPPLSGLELFNCEAFTPPTGADTASAASTYSVNSGVLDIPDTTFQGEQFSVRMEYIEGTTAPFLFELLTFGEINTTPLDGLDSDLTGGLSVEPTQDFIAACHGWVLIGDFIRNRFVERNLISGETGRIYQFNTSPEKMRFDESSGYVFFTVHPNSERLYRLNLANQEIVHFPLRQEIFGAPEGDGPIASYEYGFALNDIAIGENGNLFVLLIDNVQENPEQFIPFADSGKWMGLLDANGNFLIESIPLEEPERIEYDPVQNHVFLATESNLATFDFDPATNALEFVLGTDTQVGNSCTDFSISPDGNRLAYSCPQGNGVTQEDQIEFSIWDMSPESYFDIDGEWFLEDSPVSAVFNQEGTILIASDNEKLYFFDVVTHLLLEDFQLGLQEGESVKKIRFSKDGEMVIILLENDLHNGTSKFLYMDTPAIFGTPL